ncbi:protein XNDC1N isoform X2 [Eleutherodactylus coqui]
MCGASGRAASRWFLRMAPVRIRHIVSFSSQDPRHPAENLLMEDGVQPWLSRPGERCRQLRVELQLERACHIRYIDIGNSGSAFLQIDVGRSIWPLDKAFATLLPTTTLMSPADARATRNLRGVRMFKEGDFLQEAAAEQWDRLRLTCAQPFNKLQQFGLSFIRVRSAPSEEDEGRRSELQDDGSAPASPLHPTAGSKDPEARSHIEEKLRGKLPRPASPPPACVSRSARMLQLSAAKSRKRSQPVTAPPSPPIPRHGGENGGQLDSPMSSGSCPETLTAKLRPSQKEHVTPGGRRRLKMMEARRRRAQIRKSERHLTAERECAGTAPRSTETDRSVCPICSGHFPAAHLPAHAATCGEAPGSPCIVVSSSDDDWDDIGQRAAAPRRPGSWVQCPLCGFPFQDSEIENHASTCGE